ncbi:hypothetical protein Q31b_35020 [Novipirellula aureliae]|uniref:Uncharacterized protein n=1 Tax=Novipirellula aureliae TaxID=2527966 RepID=A0A5C6DW51_9BACT|nr:hypothetical protein [Novipirellula aureliae]TWU40157.1 hypothetical protein Q31b_35020 [Novipirellula aureliae]
MKPLLVNLIVGGLSLTILPGMSTPTTTRVTPETFEELVRLQQSVGDLQGELNRGRDQLEEDRRQWDQRERRAPVIAAAPNGLAPLEPTIGS